MGVEGVSSVEVAVTSGVPQGSILGPLLFLVAFNGIFDVTLSRNSTLERYADDASFCKPVYTDSDIIAANSDMERLCAWIEAAGFRLQLRKTKYMLITRKRYAPNLQVHIEGNVFEKVHTYKLLSVTVSEDLSWSPHISSVCLRSKCLLGCLYRTFNLASPKCLDRIYKAVVRPVLEYTST